MKHFQATTTSLDLAPKIIALKQSNSSQTQKLNPKIIEVLDGMGWKTPTEVQGLCLPHSLKGHDVAGFAQTGTGKTGVFLITAADKL